jgi:hypothetical protein
VGKNLGPEESELSSGAAHVVAEPVEGADQVADGPEFPRREASLSIYNRKCIRVLLLVAPALKGCGVRWFVVTRRAPVQSSAEELRPVRLDMVPHPSPFTHLGMRIIRIFNPFYCDGMEMGSFRSLAVLLTRQETRFDGPGIVTGAYTLAAGSSADDRR